MQLTRRTTLGLLASTLAAPALGQTARFDSLADRAQALDQLHALIVMKDGETAFENAFRGPGLSTPVNVKSVSKTLLSTLVGIAIDQNLIPGPDATVSDLAPRLIPDAADPQVRSITLGHLMSLRAGLERTSGPNYGPWVGSRNWVANALARPMIDRPGGRFLYSTGSTHILGAALTEATGRSLLDLSRDWLGAPLGIEFPAWTRDPQGYFMGGNNMSVSPRGLARFAEMFRQGGRWNGTQVVSQNWIDIAWTPRTRSPWSRHDYGYGWFLARIGDTNLAYGRGYGGQMVYVIPDHQISVVVTSDPNRPARSGGYVGDLNRMLATDILPALS